MRLLPWLLLSVPVAPLLHYLVHAGTIWVFAAAGLGIGVLADWVRRATDQLADRAGPAIGGLLNVTFGNTAEFLLAIFVLFSGNPEVVRAQLAGSIVGSTLFGLGFALLVGGWRRERQRFSRERAGLLASLLIVVVIALLLPAVFAYSLRSDVQPSAWRLSEQGISFGVSAVAILLYCGNLLYTLVTHRDVFAREGGGEASSTWSLKRSLVVLIAATAAIACEAQIMSSALSATAQSLHVSTYFLGIVVLALIGNSADIFDSAYFASEDRLGLVMSICIGSAVQIALLVAPLLVFASVLVGHPMNLVFSQPLELFALAGAAFIVNAITSDGETTWFEGALLLGVYIVLAFAFFFLGQS